MLQTYKLSAFSSHHIVYLLLLNTKVLFYVVLAVSFSYVVRLYNIVLCNFKFVARSNNEKISEQLSLTMEKSNKLHSKLGQGPSRETTEGQSDKIKRG